VKTGSMAGLCFGSMNKGPKALEQHTENFKLVAKKHIHAL